MSLLNADKQVKMERLVGYCGLMWFCSMQDRLRDRDSSKRLLVKKRSGRAVSFNRKWAAYQSGFGNPTKDHWLGLMKVFLMTKDKTKKWTLRVDLWDHEGGTAFAEYQNFRLGNKKTAFKLHVGHYSGNAGDAIRGAYTGIDQNGFGFSTIDRDNDGCSPCIFGDIGENECASSEGGGWWYSRCGSASLNGDWHPAGHHIGWASGVHWLTWKRPAPYSAKASRMMINYVLHLTSPVSVSQAITMSVIASHLRDRDRQHGEIAGCTVQEYGGNDTRGAEDTCFTVGDGLCMLSEVFAVTVQPVEGWVKMKSVVGYCGLTLAFLFSCTGQAEEIQQLIEVHGLVAVYVNLHVEDLKVFRTQKTGGLEGGTAFAEYPSFRLEDEKTAVKLHVGQYSGDARDAIRGAYTGIDQNGFSFSTVDRDNDGCSPCIFGDIYQNDYASSQGGGWWYSRCGSASLNTDWHPAGHHIVRMMTTVSGALSSSRTTALRMPCSLRMYTSM
ncbi:hypothetical protein INR49_009484, partial [Caranx melampygus]